MRVCPFKTGYGVLIIFVVIITAFLLIQNSLDPELNLPPIRAAVPKLPSSGLIVLAKEKKFFDEYSVPVEIVWVDTGKQAVEKLTRGEADVAVAYETPLIQALVEGHPVRILTELHSSTRNTSIVFRKDRFEDEIPLDLGGHRVGVILGTNAEFFLSLYMMANGLTPSDVKIVPEDWKSLVENLKNGSTDAAIVWEPRTTELAQENTKLFGVQRSAFYTEISALATLQPSIDNRNESIEALIRGLAQAHRYLQDYPQDGHKAIAEGLELPLEDADHVWESLDLHLGLSSVLNVLFQVQGKWLAQRGYVVPEDFSKYYASEYLLRAAPATVTYK